MRFCSRAHFNQGARLLFRLGSVLPFDEEPVTKSFTARSGREDHAQQSSRMAFHTIPPQIDGRIVQILERPPALLRLFDGL